MSKHKMVNGQLLQMNKPYSQLKNKQKEKISNWMYEAYKKQMTWHFFSYPEGYQPAKKGRCLIYGKRAADG